MRASGEARAEPGLAGVVPFRWACHRCGHCCTAGEGRVWLEPGEPERLAACLGLAPEAFAARHLRTLADPRTGALRPSLREESGRCTLLEGANACTVYAARPRQCRSFPFWETVLADRASFERARAVCPGIAVEVPADARAPAFAALEALYAGLDPPPARCTLARADPWLTGLEADHLLERAGPPPAGHGRDGARCPYLDGARCAAGDARPLACRTAEENARQRLRALAQAVDYPAAYGPVSALLASRGARAVDSAESECES